MAMTNIWLRIDATVVVRGQVCVAGDTRMVDVKTADRLVERGLATVVGEDAHTDEQHVDELDGMTVDELKEYAVEAGVDLTGMTERADILAAIREAM